MTLLRCEARLDGSQSPATPEKADGPGGPCVPAGRIPIAFNEERDTVVAHHDPVLNSVLHVIDRDWHGIRSATAALPGGKLAITHKNLMTVEEIEEVFREIRERGYRAVCFQGYSPTADHLAEALHLEFGKSLKLSAVTHVTTSQFEHHFEMEMLERIHSRLSTGVLARAGSVKPDFYRFLEKTWPKCIINVPPDLSPLLLALPKREAGTVFIPVENSWRKNLYTQIIAAQGSQKVRRICVVNWPTHLERLLVLDKVQLVDFLALPRLLAHMRLAEVVANVSFSECQPMTQLEALAVGTPALVGPLRLPQFSRHPLSALCEVADLDDPGLLRRRFDLVIDQWRTDPTGLSQMISDFVALRTAAGLSSYREFLEL